MADAVQLLRAILIVSVPAQAGPSATAVASWLTDSVAVSLPPKLRTKVTQPRIIQFPITSCVIP